MVYRPTARVLAVLELLQSYGRLSGAELARRLEVDIRTVRHYIEMLQDLGIPVEAERGRYGAYRLRPGYKLPPLIFTEDEALALALSLLVGRQAGLAITEPAFESVFAKVERLLPETTRQRVRAVEQTVVFEQNNRTRPTPPALAITVLSSAVQNSRSVQLSYKSAQAEPTVRVFDPYGVANHDGLWYTIGYCHLRQGQRLFRLDRIVEIEPLEQTFDRPPDFDTLAEVQRAVAAFPNGQQIEVWIQTTLDEVQALVEIPKAHFESTGDGGVVLRGYAEDLEWVARRLAFLNVPFVIHQPAELRDILHRHALKLAENATNHEP
jgi:predicted DNA-binding transcriptional regulator YafY